MAVGYTHDGFGHIRGVWVTTTAGTHDTGASDSVIDANVSVLIQHGGWNPEPIDTNWHGDHADNPDPTLPKISQFVILPQDTVNAGQTIIFKVHLDKKAPKGGYEVDLKSVTVDGLTDTLKDMPYGTAILMIDEGDQDATFTCNTQKVTSEATHIYFTAGCQNNSITRYLTFN